MFLGKWRIGNDTPNPQIFIFAQSKSGMIKNIIFDLGNVLLDLDRDTCIQAFKDLGAHNIEKDIDVFAGKGVFELMETGTVNAAGFRNKIREQILPLASDEEIDHAWNSLIKSFPLKRIELLDKIKPQYKLFVLSNTSPIHAAWFESLVFKQTGRTMHSYFDQVFYSHDLKMAKPNIEIFNTVLEKAQINASETLLIDDAPVNTEAALKVGIHVINIKPSDEVAELDFRNPTNNLNFIPAL